MVDGQSRASKRTKAEYGLSACASGRAAPPPDELPNQEVSPKAKKHAKERGLVSTTYLEGCVIPATRSTLTVCALKGFARASTRLKGRALAVRAEATTRP